MVPSRLLSFAPVLLLACAVHTETSGPEDPVAPVVPSPAGFAPGSALGLGDAPSRAHSCLDRSPMSLTASDGTGLALTTLSAKGVVEGPLAFSELHLTFANPEPRQIEGRFAIELPPQAAISRFAMRIGNEWQEGEVVEKQAARQAYEDFLHRRQDPALLENDAGNVFRARVFPIPAGGTKEIVLSYSQELQRGDEPFRLPLCGLPQLDALHVDVAVRQADGSLHHVVLHERQHRPTADLEVAPSAEPTVGLRHGELAVVRVAPLLSVSASDMERLVLLFDTSASRALDFEGQVTRLGALVTELHHRNPKLHLTLAAVDQSFDVVFEGPARDLSDRHLDALRTRGPLGASDLSGALSWLAARPRARNARVLWVTDGVATAGETDLGPITGQIAALENLGIRRLDVLVDGGLRDEDALQTLVTAPLPEHGVVLDGRSSIDVLADRLLKSTRSGIRVEVPGASWVWPEVLDGVQPGDERLIFATLPTQTGMVVHLEGATLKRRSFDLEPVQGPLLARAHAKARIAGLELAVRTASNPAQADAWTREIVDLSTRYRVLSNSTALLVLETEQDYQRYGILRRGLSDILTVGPNGIEVLERTRLRLAKNDIRRAEPKGANKKAKVAERSVGRGRADEAPPAPPEAEPEPQAGPGPAAAAPSGGASSSPGTRSYDFEAEEAMAEAPADEADFGGSPEDDADMAMAGGPPAPERNLSSRSRRTRPRRPRPAPRPSADATPLVASSDEREALEPDPIPAGAPPWNGPFAEVKAALARGDVASAARLAQSWHRDQPADVLALVALGEAEAARGNAAQAARAYGSLIDLFPSRADLRRMAGERLEQLQQAGLPLAIDTYEKARDQRPDHPSGHRLYAFSLVKAGRYADAFEVLDHALGLSYPQDRLSRTRTALLEDLGVVGQLWVSHEPKRREHIAGRLRAHGAAFETQPSLRFVLVWETDANDVDFHIHDGKGGHAYYGSRNLPSGGTLFDDVTTGYGPEQFAIEGRIEAFPYRLRAHYYSRGPMGYGMGSLQVLEHDGAGRVRFVDHPFVIMEDSAFIELGDVRQSLFGTSTPTLQIAGE